MAASTRRNRRRSNTTGNAPRQNRRTESGVPNLRQAVSEFRRAGRELMTAVFFGAAESALEELDTTLRSPVRTPAGRVAATPNSATERPAAPRRRRRTARATTRATTPGTTAASTAASPRQRRTRSIDLSNLGRGTRVIDRLYNVLPSSGRINRATLTEDVNRTGKRARPQEIGGALKELARQGIVRDDGGFIERLRAAA